MRQPGHRDSHPRRSGSDCKNACSGRIKARQVCDVRTRYCGQCPGPIRNNTPPNCSLPPGASLGLPTNSTGVTHPNGAQK